MSLGERKGQDARWSPSARTLLVLLTLIVACTPAASLKGPFPCRSDSDCPNGLVCDTALKKCATPAASSTDGGSNPACVGMTPHSLNDLYSQYFDKGRSTGCSASGCHGSGAGGLTFTDARSMWLATVGRPALESSSKSLIVPGDPANSYLFQKLSGAVTPRMPSGGPYLDSAALAAIAGWICAGAPQPTQQPDGGGGDGGAEDGGSDGGLADGGADAGSNPVITSFAPASGVVGTPVSIAGTGFSSDVTQVQIAFNGTPATVATAADTMLTTFVPQGATSGPISVSIDGAMTASSATFQVIQPNPIPALTSVSPDSVEVGSSDLAVMVSGDQFISLSAVELDGAALATEFVDAHTLNATIPASSLVQAGNHTVTVTTPGPGGGTTTGVSFTVNNPMPSIAALSPASVLAGSTSIVVTVSGSGFVAGSHALVNGADTPVSFTSSNQVSVAIPDAALVTAGSVVIAILNPAPGGGTSSTASLAVNNPTPSITGVSPASVIAGSGATSLTLTGSNFVSNSQVLLDGAPLMTTFVDGTHLTAQLDAGSAAVAGTHALTVQNGTPGGGVSSGEPFTVENPVPAITSLTPDASTVGTGPITLTVTGTGFVSSSPISFNGIALVSSSVDATTLSATIPASALTSAGTFDVTVSNPLPGGGTSTAAVFTVQNPAPTVTSLSPATVMAGSGTTTVTVNGASFEPESAILYDGVGLPSVYVSATQLTVSLDATLLASAGVHSIAVTTRGPGGGTSAAVSFVVQNPVPQIGTFSPAALQANSTDQDLTLDGSGFATGMQATANGSQATIRSLVSATQVVVTVPAAQLSTAGAVSIVLVNPAPGGGSSTSVSVPVQNPVPSITSLTPSSATAGGGSFTLDIVGTGVLPGTQAQWDGANLASTVLGPTELSATVGSSLLTEGGSHAITLKNPSPGGGTSASVAFTVNNAVPTLTSISPSTVGANGAAFALSLTGTGFNAQSVVTLDGSPVTTTLVSSTSLTAQMPVFASSGSHSIAVTAPAPGGGTSATLTLTVSAANVPNITSLSPMTATSNTPFTLTVSGSGFSCATPKSSVIFDGTSYSPDTCTASQLTVSIPATVAGTYSVQVKNQGQTSNTVSYTVADPNPVPVLSSITPATALAGDSALTLTATGSGFVAGSTVLFNGVARTTTFVSSTSLTATLLASDLTMAGSFPVVVQSPAPGGGTSGSVAFAVVAPNPLPTLASASPSSVGAGSGAVTVTLTGTNFVNGAVASLNGGSRPTTFVSATELTVDLSASDTQTAGSDTLTATNPSPGGGSSNGIAFSIVSLNPVPTITSLSPSSAVQGGAAFTLTTNGTGFVQGATLNFNGSPRTTTFVSSTEVTADILASDLTTAGTATVTVTNPSPGGGTSAGASFQVVAPNPVPSLSSLTPASANAGSGALSVTLTGTGFINGSTTTFNGASRTTTFLSSTQLTIALLATDTQIAGNFPIAVSNPSPGGGTSGTLSFAVVAVNPVPSLGSLSPSSAATGGTGFNLTVTGTGFVSGSTVSFNGNSRVTTFVSSSDLTAAILASDIVSSGSFPVTVTSPAPGGGTSNTLTFTVATTNPTPSITGLSPSSATAGGSGTSVTITGSGFVASSVANFNGSPRTTTFSSSTQLTVALTSADLQSAGSYPITVTNPAPGGGTSNSFTFSVVAPNPTPVLTSISPTSTSAGGAALTLTATGSGFVSGSTIVFNGVSKTTTFVSSTSLTATLSTSDVASAGTFTVDVTSPAPGGGTSGSVTFTVTNPSPVATSISPTTIAMGSGSQSISVSGSNFVSTSTVEINGSPRTTQFVNSTLLTATLLSTDVANTGTLTVTVVNPTPGGGTSSGLSLTVASNPNPVPSISSFSPCGTVAGSGSFTLTINGSGFVQGTTATFNGTALTVSYVSASQVTASIPGSLIASAPTNDEVSVVVTNPTPGGGASSSVSFGIATQAVTLSANVQPIFTASCATNACHGGAMPAEGMNLTSGKAYSNLVGVACSECASRDRVLSCGPGPLESYLVAKISGTDLCSGSQMPKTGSLSAAEQQTIIDWVAQGAPQ